MEARESEKVRKAEARRANREKRKEREREKGGSRRERDVNEERERLCAHVCECAFTREYVEPDLSLSRPPSGRDTCVIRLVPDILQTDRAVPPCEIYARANVLAITFQ